MSVTGKKDFLRLGDWNALCQVCGFKYKASELRKRWDGLRVCSKDFETRQPQDLIRGKQDNSSVPWASTNEYTFRDVTRVDGSDL